MLIVSVGAAVLYLNSVRAAWIVVDGPRRPNEARTMTVIWLVSFGLAVMMVIASLRLYRLPTD